MALDEKRGFLFLACDGGGVTVLDEAYGKLLGKAASGASTEVIAYSQNLGHLYVLEPETGRLDICRWPPLTLVFYSWTVPPGCPPKTPKKSRLRASSVLKLTLSVWAISSKESPCAERFSTCLIWSGVGIERGRPRCGRSSGGFAFGGDFFCHDSSILRLIAAYGVRSFASL